MDDFKISQLTKEIVAAKLKQMQDPCAAAAALVKETLKVALKGLPAGSIADSRVAEDACQGAMTALLLNDQNLAKGAVLILEAACDAGMELNIDQLELMRSALRGLADMKRFVQPAMIGEIAASLEARFQGAGSAFDALCREGSGRETPSRAPEMSS